MNPVTAVIPHGYAHAISIEAITRKVGTTPREARKMIEKARRDGEVVINLQDGRGYFIADIKEDALHIAAYIRQEKSRARNIYRSIKTLERVSRGLINDDK